MFVMVANGGASRCRIAEKWVHTYIVQGFSSFFAKFDDFSKFCSCTSCQHWHLYYNRHEKMIVVRLTLSFEQNGWTACRKI